MDEHTKFRGILLLAADTPEQLRSSDVERILEDAMDQGCLEAFRTWLLAQQLHQRTRDTVVSFGR